MFRKIASISVALVVAGGVMIAVPADAAVKISNGVACKKSGQTTKTSFGSYKCGKNPLSTSKKLVWLSTDCIAAATSALKSASTAAATVTKFKEQIPVIDLGIAAENANKVEIQAKLDDSKARLELAKVKLAAATTDATKRTYTSAVGSWTSAIRAYESKIRGADVSIKKLEAAKLAAINKPAELAANVADSRETAKLICTTGL
jgi:hypothetical protein